MNSTCIFCIASLGTNGILELFPIGVRLAFDANRGRLWVVCARCARWNLSPLEERWEAIEECERLFRSAALRVASPQIGLARVGESLELVRIGDPSGEELAAWRYGRELQQRRRWGRLVVETEAGIRRAAPFVVAAAASLTPLAAFGPIGIGAAISVAIGVDWLWDRQRLVTRLAASDGNGRSRIVRQKHIQSARLIEEVVDGVHAWRFEIGVDDGTWGDSGGAADHAMALVLASMNRAGASGHQLELALKKIEWFKDADGMYRFASRHSVFPRGYEQSLALEMTAHERMERVALDGELVELTAAWRRAERIAAIADNLLLPSDVERRMASLRQE